MIRTKYEVKMRTEDSVEAETEFEDDITYHYSNYNEIYNYFSKYDFVHFWEDFFYNEYNCQLKCHSKYYLQISSDTGNLFFGKILVSTMYITKRGEDPTLLALQSFDDNNPIEEINRILRDPMSFEKVKVCIAMEIKFFLSQSLDPLQAIRDLSTYEISEQILGRSLTGYEREQIDDLQYHPNDSDTEEPQSFSCPVESSFTTDKCCICLTEKPDIILFPCLHNTVCLQCEERGKLSKCPTCRLKINRKII